MSSLESYAARIIQLAIDKGFGNDIAWLLYGCHKEVQEFTQAIEDYLAGKLRLDCKFCHVKKVVEQETGKCLACGGTYTIWNEIVDMAMEEIGGEYAGIMHYIDQAAKKVFPDLNLDEALEKEIRKNYNTPKKTFDNGKIIKK